jgi:GNAT superfamily N-acetyltransferase
MIVQPSTIPRIEASPNFWPLIDEYADESAMAGLPRPTPNMELYRRLETAGALHAFEATDEGGLIGFISIVTTELPHYGRIFAATESFFVAKAKRATGAGLKLLRDAEAKARALGSPGLGVSAPSRSHLAELLPKLGYSQTNVVFFKRLLDG